MWQLVDIIRICIVYNLELRCSTDTYGAGLNFSYPIGEGTSLGFGLGYANIHVHTGDYAPQEIVGSPERPKNYRDLKYIQRPPEGGIYPEKLEDIDNLLMNNIDPFIQPSDGFINVHGDTYNNYKLRHNLFG